MGTSWQGDQLELHYGPVHLRVRATADGRPHRNGATAAAARARRALDELAAHKVLAFRPIADIDDKSRVPEVLRLMIAAVRSCSDTTLTPMAAVAGAFAQAAMEAALAAGARTVVVDNGGDIAVAVEPGDAVRVGVARSLADRRPTHVIVVTHDSGIGGVCTSGLGGRSFTRGIAEATVVVARTAAVADACATVVANAVTCDDPGIERCLAAELDPDTDIPDLPITRRVGQLPVAARKVALRAGTHEARRLRAHGLIIGAVLGVDGLPRVVIPSSLATPLR